MHRHFLHAAVAVLCAAALFACAAGAAAGTAPPDTTKAAPPAAPAGSSVTPGASGAPKVVDRVVATVEDRAIMQSDIDERYAGYLAETRRTEVPADEEKQIRAQILNMFIGNALLDAEAEKQKIKADDREIDDTVDRIIESKRTEFGSDEAFNAQLKASGLTLDMLRAKYRDIIRPDLVRQELYKRMIAPGVNVSDTEVQAYYKAHLAEFDKKLPTVTLATILFVPRPSPAVLDTALAKIRMVEAKLKAGGDFAELAKEYSDCPSAKFGGSLGTIRLEDLKNPPFIEAARKTAVGHVSPPVLTEYGYHLIKIEKVEGDQVTLRHILATAQATPADVEAAGKLADSVRAAIEGGADFAKMAGEYSGDNQTKDAGGLVRPDQILDRLGPELQAALKGLPAGGLTPVMREARGFRIFKVVSWNESRPYTFEEAKGEIQKQLENQKTEEKTTAYVEELKKSFSVVIEGEPSK